MAHRNKAISLRVPPALSAKIDELQNAMPAMPRGTLLRLLLEIATEGSIEEQTSRVTRKLLNHGVYDQPVVEPRNRLNSKQR